MRVAIVTESFLPSANGVTTSVLRVLDHLSERGHDALVICPGPAPERYGRFRVHAVPALPWRAFSIGLPSPQLTRALLEFKPDVLHAASPFTLGAQALTWAHRMRIPSVAIFQTDIAGFARQHGLRAAAPAAWAWLRTIHDHADLTLAPTSRTLEELTARGFNRLAIWGRGVDTQSFHPQHRTSPDGLSLRAQVAPGGEKVIGYIGRLAAEKGVERLACVRDLPGTRLLIGGDGPSRDSVAAALGDRATLLGRLDGTALATAYAVCDVFVHTGVHETFGQTLQEAMASGVPVVAPRAGGPIDVIDEGETGILFEPTDDADLRRAVAGLLADDSTRFRIGERGRRVALQRSWTSICDQLLSHYASAISSTRTSAELDLRNGRQIRTRA